MAKKKAYDSIARELQDKLPQKKLILGTERTLKGLKNSTIQKVVVSSNASAQVKEDIAYYAGIGKVEIAEIPQTNVLAMKAGIRVQLVRHV